MKILGLIIRLVKLLIIYGNKEIYVNCGDSVDIIDVEVLTDYYDRPMYAVIKLDENYVSDGYYKPW